MRPSQPRAGDVSASLNLTGGYALTMYLGAPKEVQMCPDHQWHGGQCLFHRAARPRVSQQRFTHVHYVYSNCKVSLQEFGGGVRQTMLGLFSRMRHCV